MANPTIDHPELGKLNYEPEYDSWSGRFELSPGIDVDFSFSGWTGTDPKLESAELIRRGFAFLKWARSSESAARARIADELLETYNDTWALEEGDGGFGQLSRPAFLKHIAPESIVVHVKGNSYWYYNDGGLFANHVIEVRVNQDREITEVCLAG